MDANPNEPIPLRAGPLTLAFDRGELRWLRLGEREVLRAIYVAVRPPTWETVPAELEDVRVEAGPDAFRLRFHARHREGPLWFEWDGHLDGDANGRVRFEMEGVACSTFLRNRIGLCVLHPVSGCAGRGCKIDKADGTALSDAFPRRVSPHQPFLDVRALRHEVAPGVEAEVRFEGEVFETEDQRNWSDASFKTYSTPLALALPVEVREGEQIRQAVTLSLHGADAVEGARLSEEAAGGWLSNGVVRVALDPGTSWEVPRLGMGLGASRKAAAAVESWRAFAPTHLRVDVRLARPGWRDDLAAASESALAGATRLEVAAFVSAEKTGEELKALADAAESRGAPVDAWLVFDAATGTTTPELARHAREILLPRPAATGSPALLGGGSDVCFAELNRQRDAASELDLVTLAVNPQVHAFDDATLVENTTSLGWIAETIRAFAPDAPLALSPVTLRARPDADSRQTTSFAAGWTLGLLAAAAEAGFARLTLFELEGPAGVMEAGRPFPVGRVLADLAELTRSSPAARVIAARPEDPWRCLALAAEAAGRLRVYLFNPPSRSQDLVVAGLPAEARVRRLERGTSDAGFTVAVATTAIGGDHALTLDTHEVAVLDRELERR
jgi:hypothetical protein